MSPTPDQGLQRTAPAATLAAPPPSREQRVGFAMRLLIYLAVWFLAAAAVQVFLQPDGPTETTLTPLQQRICWPLETPLMAVVGLAQSVTWPDFPSSIVLNAAATCLVAHAIFTLTRVHRRSLFALICLQVLLLAIAIIYGVRLSQLPAGS